MKAVQITTLDGPEAVEVVDLPEPVAGDGQVLIRVKAAGVSFPEVLQSRGQYQIKPPLPFVPGSEVAGEIVTAPEDSGLTAGDRVAGFCLLGGFAQFAVAKSDMVFPLPANVTFEQGASIPLNYMTAHFSLLQRGGMVPGESVLVHGAAGGVGTASIQTAKAFGAGRVIAVASTEEKGAVALAAGADEYVLVDGFKDKVKAAFPGSPESGAGVDIVVDPVGGDRFTDSLRCLKADGRLLVIGFTAGEIPTVQVNRLLLNNISVAGVHWGGYALNRPGFLQQQWDDLLPHIKSGAITPPISSARPLDDVAAALLEIDERRAVGKVLLTDRS